MSSKAAWATKQGYIPAVGAGSWACGWRSLVCAGLEVGLRCLPDLLLLDTVGLSGGALGAGREGEGLNWVWARLCLRKFVRTRMHLLDGVLYCFLAYFAVYGAQYVPTPSCPDPHPWHRRVHKCCCDCMHTSTRMHTSMQSPGTTVSLQYPTMQCARHTQSPAPIPACAPALDSAAAGKVQVSHHHHHDHHCSSSGAMGYLLMLWHRVSA